MAGGRGVVTPNANRHLVLVEFPTQTPSAAGMCTRGETTALQGHRASRAPREPRELSSLPSPLPQSHPTIHPIGLLSLKGRFTPLPG